LPVWHEISREYLSERSPMLADRVAARTSEGIDAVVEMLLRKVRPDRSLRTIQGKSASLTPTHLTLHNGTNPVITPAIIHNPGTVPLYSLWIKIVPNPQLPAEQIDIETGARTTALEVDSGLLSLSRDAIRLDLILPTVGETPFLLLHTLRPSESREMLLSSRQGPATADLALVRFSLEPETLQLHDGKPMFAFSPPESGKLKRISVPLRRGA